MKKILAIVLALLMLLPTVVACNQTPETPDDTTPAETTPATPDQPVVTDKIVADVPSDEINYEVKVLTRKDNWVAWDIVYDDSDAPLVVDTLNNAIKLRNDAMYDKYGVSFVNIPASVYDEASSKIATNKDEYDIILPTVTEAGLLAQKGYLIPVSGLEYIDPEKPWYDQRCLDDLAIKGENFFFFSDITAVDLDAIWTFFFNHALVTKYSLEDPYELVANKTWTLDKMLQMCDTATEDSDGIPTKEDSWGIVGHDYIATSLYIGSGERVATADAKGKISLTMNKDAARVQTLISNIIDMREFWCRYALNRSYTDYGSYDRYGFDSDDNYPEIIQVFTSGNALFMAEVLSTLRELADYDMKVGVLPTPMLNESQREYYCAVNDKAPAMCVPTTCGDTSRISIIIEAWAAESHYTLLPAYYDNCMTTRYAKDAITSDILDMILESRTYDLGIYYGWGDLAKRFTAMVYNGKTDFASLYGSYYRIADLQIDNFMKYFK